MTLHFSRIRALMLSAYSASDCDSTSPVLMPRSSLAATRPSCDVWLNDLSSKPPESETMQALKLAAPAGGGLLDSVSVGSALVVESEPDVLSSSPRSPQALSPRASTPTSATILAVFLTAPPLHFHAHNSDEATPRP
jgi:hypothetical protein